MGLLAVLRSRACASKTIGLMITASHNPVEDNGVKLIDPLGEMLEADWEKYATELANTDNMERCLRDLTRKVKTKEWNDVGNVAIARDTRPSGKDLTQAVIDGIEAFGGKFNDLGILATPQLHFIVRCINDPSYGVPSEEGYYKKISQAFINLTSEFRSKITVVNVDGANGVGALKMVEMAKHLDELLPINVFNDASNGELNKNCGADYVKVAQKCPEGFALKGGEKCVSVDGDADRIVYFYQDSLGIFHLLDGDKISTFIASYLKEKLEEAGLQLNKGLGVVQTAYANGSSTAYVEEMLKVPVACVKTGVKHLHSKAHDFDVGVYFEANGHGTVLFSENFKTKLSKALQHPSLSVDEKEALQELESAMNLINETVGDAMSDMLLVETILCKKQWGLNDWDSCYQDLPNRQRKVQVKDRSVITTTNAERKTTTPKGLQEEIDKLVAEYDKGRSFVRPSGTEDVVRVYAEARTQKEADALALAVSKKVYNLAGGIGARPT